LGFRADGTRGPAGLLEGEMGISDSEFQIPDSGFQIPDSKFRIQSSERESQIWNLEFRIWNLGFHIFGSSGTDRPIFLPPGEPHVRVGRGWLDGFFRDESVVNARLADRAGEAVA
jgi:hypothetical protein